jgi:hypothetical protein
LTKKGKPDYKRLKLFLDQAKLPSEAFVLTAALRENAELNREYLPVVRDLWIDSDRLK